MEYKKAGWFCIRHHLGGLSRCVLCLALLTLQLGCGSNSESRVATLAKELVQAQSDEDELRILKEIQDCGPAVGKVVCDQYEKANATGKTKLLALIRLYDDPISRGTLLAACDDPSPKVRDWAIGFLQGRPTRETKRKLESIVRRGQPADRVQAIKILGRLADSASLPVLLDATHDPEGEVRRAAVWSLVSFPGDKSVQRCEELVAKKDSNALESAVCVLSILDPENLVAKRKISGIIKLIEEHRNDILLPSVRFLVSCETPLARGVFLSLLDDADPALRRESLTGLAHLAPGPLNLSLIGRLIAKDPDVGVRRAGLSLARSWKVKGLIPVIAGIALQNREALSFDAATCLRDYRTREAALALLPLLDKIGPDEALSRRELRYVAAGATVRAGLESYKTKVSMEEVRRMVRSQDSEDRLLSTMYIDNFPHKAFLPEIRRLANDPNVLVAYYAKALMSN